MLNSLFSCVILSALVCLMSSNKIYGQTEENELKQELIQLQSEFIDDCGKADFSSAQKLLHPWGVYFFHHGKIPPCLFDQESLEEISNPLFKWGQEESYGTYMKMENDSILMAPKIVNGMYWVDTLQTFTENLPKLHNSYGALGYGFTGHYSSDHIVEDKILEDHPTEFEGEEIRVLYTEHNTLGGYEVLMVEFYPDLEGNWKIYAIGELYWTP